MFHLNSKATDIKYEQLWLVNEVVEPVVNACRLSHDDIINASIVISQDFCAFHVLARH